MSNSNLKMSDDLFHYLRSVSLREPELLIRLREETSKDPMAVMQICPEQGQFFSLLVSLLGVTKALEVGVFTGYSSLSVALAMPAHGTLIACDVSEEWTTIARRYWKAAEVEHKIKLRLAPALDTMEQLLEMNESNSFDFIFIDADKTNYDGYFERGLKLLRPKGLMVFDNVLWSGRVADPNIDDPDTVALRKLNAKLHRDPRIKLSMLPIGDGLTLAMKV